MGGSLGALCQTQTEVHFELRFVSGPCIVLSTGLMAWSVLFRTCNLHDRMTLRPQRMFECALLSSDKHRTDPLRIENCSSAHSSHQIFSVVWRILPRTSGLRACVLLSSLAMHALLW